MVRVYISRGKLRGLDACWIEVKASESEDEGAAYSEYVRKLRGCRAKIGVLTVARVPWSLFIALLRATAEVLGTAAVAVAEGVLVVYSDGTFRPGEVLR